MAFVAIPSYFLAVAVDVGGGGEEDGWRDGGAAEIGKAELEPGLGPEKQAPPTNQAFPTN